MLTAGCAVGGSQATIGPGDSPPIDLPHAGRALVANSLGETLSDLDFAQTPAALRNDLAPTGQSPNDLLVAGDRLLVVNSLSNSLQVCRLNTLETTAEISTGPRSNPWNVEAVGGLAYVTCWASAEVIAIDLGT
ncbi:MAG TPA: hypothetical protein VEI97_00600, partial [bacterium]|nr:hypothetical protein [bacterium]